MSRTASVTERCTETEAQKNALKRKRQILLKLRLF